MNRKADDILKDLAGQTFKVEDEDLFVDEIMGRLSDDDDNLNLNENENDNDNLNDNADQNLNKDKGWHGTLVLALRTVSTIAAVLVVGVFAFVNMDSGMKSENVECEAMSLEQYGNGTFSKGETPQEYISQYAARKSKELNKNKLISMYNEK